MAHSDSFDAAAWRVEFSSAAKRGDGDRLRALRREIYDGTLAKVKAGGYNMGGEVVRIDNTGVQERAEFFSAPFALPAAEKAVKTRFAVVECDCLEAAYVLGASGLRPCVLNMASRRNPGGGVMNGAGAQEENLFRRSNLFLSLYQFAEYAGQYAEYGIRPSVHQYPLDRNNGGVYSGGVTVFRGSEANGYALMAAPFTTAFVTVPALNAPELVSGGDGKLVIAKHLVEPVKERMRTVLRIAGKHGHDALVLGAWGCGAYKNPPEHIARLFKEVFGEAEFAGRFSLALFAIISDHNTGKAHNPEGNFLPFKRVFAHQGFPNEILT